MKVFFLEFRIWLWLFYVQYFHYWVFQQVKTVYSSMGVNNSCDENFFIFCMRLPYHIIYSIGTKKWYVTKQIKKKKSISMKWSLVSHESLDPNSEKIEWFYKRKIFINDVAFGASLFVFCDLNTYFQFQFAVN